MTLRFQRLLIILLSLVFVATSVILFLINSKNNLIFFYTPTELISSSIEIKDKVRIGGFVKEKSIKKNKDTNIYNFIITDNLNEIKVKYKGILPDLFKEKQGAVVEGILLNNEKILAEKVFAKHDENYMPTSIKKQLEKTEYWKKNYK